MLVITSKEKSGADHIVLPGLFLGPKCMPFEEYEILFLNSLFARALLKYNATLSCYFFFLEEARNSATKDILKNNKI